MFDQSFVNTERPASKPLSFTISILLQILAVTLLILFSIMSPQALHMAQLKALLLAPVAPPPPHIQTVKTITSPAPINSAPTHSSVYFSPHPTITNKAIPLEESLGPTPNIEVPFATGDPAANFISSIGVSSKPVPPAPKPESKPKSESPLHVSEGVALANLIYKVVPTYPKIAVATRIQGTVHFRAVIDTNGRISELQLLSGHPIFVAPAREAVLQWRYRPTLLNGTPVSVLTDIQVIFRLGTATP
jgi:protein TonB